MKLGTIPAVIGMLYVASCTVETVVDPGERLVFAGYSSDGSRLWFDTEREEICGPFQTEHDGVRCIPQFARVHGAQLGYDDASCSRLASWSDLQHEPERYLAYVEEGTETVYAVVRVLNPGPPPEMERYERLGSGCAMEFADVKMADSYITPAIHMSNFAVVGD